MKTVTFRTSRLLLVCFLVTSCRPQLFRPPAWSDKDARVYVLAPATAASEHKSMADRISRLFPNAPRVPVTETDAILSRSLQEGAIVIISDPRSFPQNFWTKLEDYLNAGGAAIFAGINPFEDRAILDSWGRCIPERDFLVRMAKQAEFIESVSSVAAWEHRNERDEIGGRVRVGSSPTPGWSAVEVEVESLSNWNALILPAIPQNAISPQHRTMVFYARGSEKTSRIFIECTERDGSVWRISIPLARVWSLQIWHEGQFRFVSGPPGRGGRADSLHFADMARLAMGVSSSTDLQTPGPHRFDLSEVRWSLDERSSEEARREPDIRLLSPRYRRYTTRASRFRSLVDDQVWTVKQPLTIGSPFPRSRSVGGTEATSSRWIPLLEAVDDHDLSLGWPASLFVEVASNTVIRNWAWVALPDESPEALLQAALLEAARKLRSGVYLHHAGLPRASILEREPIAVVASAAWLDRRSLPKLDVIATLHRDGQPIPGRRVRAPLGADGRAELSLGSAPTISEPSVWSIRMDLVDPVRGVLYDTIWQFLAAPEPARSTDRADWITTRGAEFVYRGRRQFWLGVHYRPAYSSGLGEDEASQLDWLNPSFFDAQVVERDFDRLVEIGVNAVSLDYHHVRNASALRYVVQAAKRRGLWVYLRLPVWNPFKDEDVSFLKTLIESAHIVDEPAVFAVDIPLGVAAFEGASTRLKQIWRSWLIEQYGSEGHAEEMLGMPWAQLTDENFPPRGLETDSPYGRAYRRFLDDYMSQQIGYMVRTVRSWGIRQLITAHMTVNLSSQRTEYTADASWGRVHLDFYALTLSNMESEQIRFGGLWGAVYARAVSDGKPVVWTDYSVPVPGSEVLTSDRVMQAERFQQFFDMSRLGRASGVFGGVFSGGWSEWDRTDKGLFEPDGTPRPVGTVYREMSNRVRRERGQVIAPWRGHSLDVDAFERGPHAVWAMWREIHGTDAADGNVTELRLHDFGKKSKDWAVQTLGGQAFQAPAPLRSMNAEWGRLEVNGQEVLGRTGDRLMISRGGRLQAEIINTGPVSWDASREGQSRTVWIRLTRFGRSASLVPIPPIRFGRRHIVTWLATEPGEWVARPWLADVGEFGPPLRIIVTE